ncbi:MAG: hypothetical protein HYR76_10295 [Ignavibacteria bacterium]|nr:hypothetical protein [Ignavibacteria bacterium]
MKEKRKWVVYQFKKNISVGEAFGEAIPSGLACQTGLSTILRIVDS